MLEAMVNYLFASFARQQGRCSVTWLLPLTCPVLLNEIKNK